MNIFVAGATGAIGRPLITALIESGHVVTGMTHSESGAARLVALGAAVARVSDLDAAGVEQALRQELRDYMNKEFERYALRDTLRPFFERYDILLSPVLPVTSLDVGKNLPDYLGGGRWKVLVEHGTTSHANQTARLFAWSISLPSFLGGYTWKIFDGAEFTRFGGRRDVRWRYVLRRPHGVRDRLTMLVIQIAERLRYAHRQSPGDMKVFERP